MSNETPDEVLYDPADDDFQDEAPEGELADEEVEDAGAFVPKTVQDVDA